MEGIFEDGHESKSQFKGEEISQSIKIGLCTPSHLRST